MNGGVGPIVSNEPVNYHKKGYQPLRDPENNQGLPNSGEQQTHKKTQNMWDDGIASSKGFSNISNVEAAGMSDITAKDQVVTIKREFC
jgi:hypothetical protein